MSEIDDIFASIGGKKKVRLQSPLKVVFPSFSASSSSSKPRKKKRKRANPAQDGITSNDKELLPISSSSEKRPPPETVVDISHLTTVPSKRQKVVSRIKEEKRPMVDTKKIDVDAHFKDSRGTANRRTTKEGWLVYKEDELGIGDQGGDTALCPFDCDCCF